MAIYKPNNFYPYLQEVDMEALEGTKFSCQVNTDGAMCAGGKVKIYLPDKKDVLYDNLYQFQKIDSYNQVKQTPIPNGDFAEFEVKPYEVQIDYDSSSLFGGNSSYDINNSNGNIKIPYIDFIYSNPQEQYDNRRNLCPYNLFNINVEDFVYSIIIYINNTENPSSYFGESKYVLPIRNINLDKLNNNGYCIDLKDLDFNDLYQDINQKHESSGKSIDTIIKDIKNCISFYICLQNDINYVWEVELFEHYFNEKDFKGTFVSDGYLTGSTQSVLWYDSTIQDVQIKEHEEDIKIDNYIEIEADSDNSDLFREELLLGYTDHGILSKDLLAESSNITINNDSFNNLIEYNDGSGIFSYTNRERLYDENIASNNSNDNIKFNLNKVKDFNNIDFYITSDIKYDRTELIMRCFSTYYSDGYYDYGNINWRILNNANIELNGESFLINNLDNVSIGEICYRIDKNGSANSRSYYGAPVIDTDYQKNPFAVNSITPIVVVSDFWGTDNECPILDVNADERKQICPLTYDGLTVRDQKGIRDEIHIIIKGKHYRAKILFPAPFDYNNFSITQDYLLPKDQYKVAISDNVNKKISNPCDNMYECYNNGKYNSLCVANMFDKNFLQKYDLYNRKKKYNEKNGFDLTSKFLIEKSDKKSNGYYIDPGKISFCMTLHNNANFSLSGNIKNESGNNKVLKWGYTIYERDNLSKYSSYIIETKNISANTTNNISIIDYPIKINGFQNPVLYIDFYMVEDLILYDISISKTEFVIDDYYPLKLDDKTMNLLNRKDDISLYITSGNKTILDYVGKSYKIEQFNVLQNTVTLIDRVVGKTIYSYLGQEDHVDVGYKLIYKKRQPISWFTKNLGNENIYNKIELKEPFAVNLKNGEGVYLYPTNDETTYNSFYAVKDTNINVDNIYVRFPGYVGKDATGNDIKDDRAYYNKDSESNTASYSTVYNKSKQIISEDGRGVKGYFYSDIEAYSDSVAIQVINWNETILQNQNLYGKQVRATAFEPNYTENTLNYYCKLFKVTHYDYETGELVFAGGLERKILPTDKYEIWRADVIEGMSNEYDITEVIKTYTRLYPAPDEIDAEGKSCNDPIMEEPIRIINSTRNQIFIQPNINFYTNEYNNAYLYFPQYGDKKSVLYSYLMKNTFYLYENSIDKLDDSQWLILLSSSLSFDPYPGVDYNLYMDTTKSVPASYFYAKSTPIIDVLFVDYHFIKENLKDNNFRYLFDTYKDRYVPITDTILSDFGVVSLMDAYFVATYKNCDTPIKRYKYKIYDANMNVIVDTDYIYDNLLACGVQGLLNNSIYLLEFECENQDGKIDYYSQSFYVKYQETVIDDIILDVQNICDMNCVSIELCYNQRDIIDVSINETNVQEFIIFPMYIDDLQSKDLLKINKQKGSLYRVDKNVIVENVHYGTWIDSNHSNWKAEYINGGLIVQFTLEDNNYNHYPLNEYFISCFKNINIYCNDGEGFYDMFPECKYSYVQDASKECMSLSGPALKIIPRGNVFNQIYFNNRAVMEINYSYSFKKGTLLRATDYYVYPVNEVVINSLDNCSIEDFTDYDHTITHIGLYKRKLNNKYLQWVKDIDLIEDQVYTGQDENEYKYIIYDYNVSNNTQYEYVLLISKDNLSKINNYNAFNYNIIKTEHFVQYDGWSMIDLVEGEDNVYYTDNDLWRFKYNLESNDIVMNTSVTSYDTLSKYPQFGYGKKNYITSGLSCLLGDVGIHYNYTAYGIEKRDGYYERDLEDLYANNITKYLKWKKFCNNGNLKLLKDIKGNKWIVRINENPNVKNNDATREQMYTISFEWTEMMDSDRVSIIGFPKGFDRKDYIFDELQISILPDWDFDYHKENNTYNLKSFKYSNFINTVIYPRKEYKIEKGVTSSISGDSVNAILLCGTYNDEKLSNVKDEILENITVSNLSTSFVNSHYGNNSTLENLIFEQGLHYENNNIDCICYNMTSLKNVDITLDSNITSARYAFANCTNLGKDEECTIEITSSNYINTLGILDGVKGKIKIIANNIDLKTYGELYEQYWNCDNITIESNLVFNPSEWKDSNGYLSFVIQYPKLIIDGIEVDEIITLHSYSGERKNIFIPQFYKEKGRIIATELSDDCVI